MAIDIDDLEKLFEEENKNLTAANRKVDSLATFTNLLLIALIRETQDSNKVLKDILRELED